MIIKPRKIPRGFFIAVHPVAMCLSIALSYLLTMAWLWPDGVSTKMFGEVSNLIFFLGTNYNHYMKIAAICNAVAHVLQCMIAIGICYKLNLRKGVSILWTFQTLIFGISSLNYLLDPQSAIINLYND